MSGVLSTEIQRQEAAMDVLAWPVVDFAHYGPVRRVRRTRVQKLSAANLHRNWVRIPHVTNHEDADVSALDGLRQEKRLTLLPFVLKAVALTLRKFPQFNASLDGDDMVVKDYVHIGFAVDTPFGLMVPVVRDVADKDVASIAREAAEMTARAREGKLKPDEMKGGCFSVSSLGGIGGRYFTPIINAPEVAILGVCRTFTQPVWEANAFVPRLMLPLSLSWDHRAVDGAAAARFLAELRSRIAQPGDWV